jgi:hypothetical protein
MAIVEFDEFYANLTEVWKSGGENGGPGGWAQYYYGVFSDVIKQNNFKTCVEVGIGYGFHAKEILDNTSVEKLYLVDPMRYYPNDGFATDVLKYGGFEKLFKNIKLNLSVYEDRYTWYRKQSLSVTQEEIPDESIDAIFIDADHSYEAVSKDLPFWWKKLRPGGWLLGDDYNTFFPGTIKAVNEFASNNKLQLEFLTKPNNSYLIYKFVKNEDM